MFTLTRRQKRGSHAAPRNGPDEALPVRPPASAAMLALAASLAGDRMVLASHLASMSDADVDRAAHAAAELRAFAAAVSRVRDSQSPPVPGFVLCLPCLLRDCRTCTDRACRCRSPAHQQMGGLPDITGAMAAVPGAVPEPALLSAPLAEPDGCMG